MKTKYIVVVLFSLLFILISFHDLAAAQANDSSNNIYQCGTLDSAGFYKLNQSISGAASCLNITSNDVYIDCSGFSITYDTGGSSGVVGINASIKAYSNLSVKGCFIIKTSAAGTDGYGIYFNRTSNSVIFNNTISTNGTANNYGIYISINSGGNNITQNVIFAKGSTIYNVGVYLSKGATNTTVSFNNITSNGTATNYGVYVLGNATFYNNNNVISYNNITTYGLGASNYGVFITSNSSLNVITGNNITTNGTTTNYGINIVGTAALAADNNSISNNLVQTFGVTTNNYGIYITTNSSNNSITSNNILTNGTTGNIGIYIASNSSNNNVSSNNITANGTTTSHGIYLVGAAFTMVNNNILYNNTIQTQCKIAASSCYGIYLQNNASSNNITSNSISTNGTTNNLGIYLVGTAALAVNYNIIALNNITTNGIGASNHGIYFITNVSYNNITGNNIITNGTTTNNGIYIYGDTATTPSNGNIISNNIIQAYGNSTGLPADYSNYGIYVRSLANQNVIINNNLTTHGTTTNYGIYVTGTAALTVNNNIISNNFIQALGTTYRNNYGIYLAINANQNNITSNIVTTSGTTGNIGIYLSGATNLSNGNLIYNNSIFTNGTTGSHGIYITTNSSNNNITGNNIIANGTGTNYGINFAGVANGPTNNNTIENNTIQTICSANSNYGVYLITNANQNNITYNTINTSGATDNYGIAISGTTVPSIGNNLLYNTIRTNGTTNNWGIYFTANANQNDIIGNDIITNGTTTGYGIYFLGAAGTSVNSNIIDNNTIQARCIAGASNCYGIWLRRLASYNNITRNNIITNGTTLNYGIYIIGTNALIVNSNIIDSNSIITGGTGISNHGILLSTNASYNVITNNTILANGSNTNYGINVVGAAAADSNSTLIDSNNITVVGTAAAVGNIGIWIDGNASNNNVTNNNLSVYGTSNSQGIELRGAVGTLCVNNLISSNNVLVNGSAAASVTDYGIYLTANTNANIITSNNITAVGNTTGYGIYLIGGAATTPANSNIIYLNNITTIGRGPSNYGVWLTSNANMNNISSNIISTSGKSTNYGIYITGTAPLTANSNEVDSNIIGTIGNETLNYGIYLLTNANLNNITNNTILTNGTTNNVGIALSGVTNISNGNIIYNNTVFTNGTTGNHGIYITTNSSNNNISENTITANGTTLNYGIYFLSIANAKVDNNTLYNNLIQTICYGAVSNCSGIFLQNNADFNNITNNDIFTHGTRANYGIYLFGTAALNLNSNLIDSNFISTDSPFDSGIYLSSYSNSTVSSNTINVSYADRIIIDSVFLNNNLTNNSFINRNYSYYDINFTSAGNNVTWFIDQYLENYTFAGLGAVINIKNSQYGEISFISAVNKSGTNFSNDIIIYNNSAYVNSAQTGLNKSANIALYNIPVDFSNPVILKDGNACPAGACYNFTSLNDGNVSFNVSSWSTYSIGEIPNTCSCPGLGSNWQIDMADFCNIAADCNLSTGNITFIGNGWTIFNATISFKNLKYPSAGQVLFIGSNGVINVG
jgi:hypothetical protein